VIHAVVRSVGVPGEVGGPAQEERAEPEALHELPQFFAARGAAHSGTTSAPSTGKKS
jgi:hypothetical protein